MADKQQLQQCLNFGREAVRQGAIVARKVAAGVSTEAVRQARIAAPIVQDATCKAWAEVQRQTKIAKPILKDAVKHGAGLTAEKSRQAWTLVIATGRNGIHRSTPIVARWIRNPSIRGKAGLACAAGLLGIVVFAAMPSKTTIDPVETRPVIQLELPKSEDHEIKTLSVVDESVVEAPVVQKSVVETTQQRPPQRRVSLNDLTRGSQPQPSDLSPRENELAQRRQQAQVELEQAAAHYEFAVQQWNAEVAACQQNSSPPGYTPQQMGQLRAMGYRQQPRQPNQALYEDALRAEQRYLQARDRCQRVSQSQ